MEQEKDIKMVVKNIDVTRIVNKGVTMTKDSPEYLKYKAEYEAKEKYKREHPEEYPWWAYFQYGWHNITYLTDDEVKEAVKFYRLIKGKTEDGREEYYRFGRQPITIIRRASDGRPDKQTGGN